MKYEFVSNTGIWNKTIRRCSENFYCHFARFHKFKCDIGGIVVVEVVVVLIVAIAVEAAVVAVAVIVAIIVAVVVAVIVVAV